MKIINIKIEEFGCLADKNYELSEGFNLAMGENESGKSTLLAFIKFIFYGLPKKTLETAADRDRSFSWKSGTASGSLTLSDEKGDIYTVYRRAVRKKTEKRESSTEEIRIIDEKSGTEVHKDESPADIFLGIPAAVFESTCFVRQSGVTDVRGEDISSALENILMSADESLNLEKALERLDGARKLLLLKKGNGGLLSELEAERDSLSARLDKAKTSYEKILSITENAEKLRREALEKRKELDKLEDLSSAVAKAETVKRFDLLREKEKELDALKAELEDFRKNAAGADGFIPDTAYAASLREALASLEGANREQISASRALEEAGDSLASEKQKTERISPLSPEEIRSRGGADKICLDLGARLAAAEKKKKSARSFFALFGVTLAAAAALVALSFAVSLPALLYAGIGAAALSAVLAFIGSAATKTAKTLTSRTESEITALGAPNGSSFEDRIEFIRNTLLLCLEREKRINELETKFETARSVAFLRKKDLEAAESKASELVEKWKSTPGGELSVVLNSAIKDAEKVIARSDELGRRILTAKGQTETLRQSLAGMNEADLRARVSPTALKIYESGHEGEVENRRRFTAEALRMLNEKAHQAEKELVRLENESEDPASLAVKLEENRKKYHRERQRYDAVMLASEALSEASRDIRSSISPILREKAEGYMSSMTDKKYSGMGIDEKYSISARSEEGGVRPVELLSAGTKDSAYLSLRLALLEVIFRDERPFLALDEALSQLDDNRAAAALRMLASYCRLGGQCILFTCHTREEKLLDGITGANIIKL